MIYSGTPRVMLRTVSCIICFERKKKKKARRVLTALSLGTVGG